MSALQEAIAAHKATPRNAETQEQYCRAYAEAGFPEHKEGICLVPWCRRKVRNNFCHVHNRSKCPGWLGTFWEVETRNLSSFNWYYHLNVEYDSYYDCYGFGCDDDGICRCGRISNARVESYDRCALIENFVKHITLGHNDIQAYCFDRVIRRTFHNMDTLDWDICVGPGYYGQEIDYVHLTGMGEIVKAIKDLVAHNTAEAYILHALKEEYGYVLPKLENKQWAIEEVDLDQIKTPKLDYVKKLNQSAIKNYCLPASTNMSLLLPRGVLLAEEGGFRLIDGHHRLQALKESGATYARFVVGRV